MSTTPVKQPNSIPAAIAAIRTLEAAGYTYNEGAQLWRPPLGKPPAYLDTGLQSRLGIEVQNGNYWVYQGDGSDHLESLTCAVVIDPRRLRTIIDNGNKFHMALQRIGSALELLAGTDITKAAVPAIEELKQAAKRPVRRGYPFADVGGEQC